MKKIPVIAYKTGGIPLQIKDQINGFLVPTGDYKKVAEIAFKLLANKDLFCKIKNHQSKFSHYQTQGQVCDWLYIFKKLYNSTLEADSALVCSLSFY